jgi:hypothetical protein
VKRVSSGQNPIDGRMAPDPNVSVEESRPSIRLASSGCALRRPFFLLLDFIRWPSDNIYLEMLFRVHPPVRQNKSGHVSLLNSSRYIGYASETYILVYMPYQVSALNSAETHKLLSDWGRGKSSLCICSQLRSRFFIFTAPHWSWMTLGRGFPLRNKTILTMLSVSGLLAILIWSSRICGLALTGLNASRLLVPARYLVCKTEFSSQCQTAALINGHRRLLSD